MSTRPRMQTAIIIARLRSKAAQVLHPVRNLFPRRLLRHRRILYSLPQKRWRAHSLKPRLPEMASSLTPRGKTAVPPGTRRAPGHVATPKNNAAPAAGKNSAQCAVSSCGYFAARHGRRGHTEYAAGADRTFSVGIPSAQQHNSAESRRDCFCPARQEKRQAKIRRAVPISRPAVQESRITAAAHRDRRYRPNPHSSAAPLCSRLTHSGAHRIQPRPMQRQTLRHRRLPLRAARHSLSAAQEKVRCSLRIQKPRSSAIPLCRLRTRQVRSQQQNIRLLLPLRDPVWQETRLRRISVCSQHLHQTVRQENSQLPIRQMSPVLH